LLQLRVTRHHGSHARVAEESLLGFAKKLVPVTGTDHRYSSSGYAYSGLNAEETFVGIHGLG
jgi:hypothetical protein